MNSTGEASSSGLNAPAHDDASMAIDTGMETTSGSDATPLNPEKFTTKTFWGLRTQPPPHLLPTSSRGAARAVSPAAHAMQQGSMPSLLGTIEAQTPLSAAKADRDEDTAIFAAVDRCDSIEEFVELVPSPYQALAKAFLLKVKTNVNRVVELEARVHRLAQAKSSGKAPTELSGLHVPMYQPGSSFAAGKEYNDTLKARLQEYIAAQTAILLDAAEEEHRLTLQASGPDVVAETIKQSFVDIYTAQKGRSYITYTSTGIGETQATFINDSRPAWSQYLRACRITSASYSSIVAREQSFQTIKKKNAEDKKELKEKAAVAVGQSSTNLDASRRKEFDDYLASKGLTPDKIKSLSGGPQGKKVSTFKGTPTAQVSPVDGLPVPLWRHYSDEAYYLRTGKHRPKPSDHKGKGKEVAQGERRQQHPLPAKPSGSGKRKDREPTGPSSAAASPEAKRFKQGGDISVPLVLSRASAEFITLARYRAEVHWGPDIDYDSIPQSLFANLSAGLKYLLFSRLDVRLPLSSYDIFCNTIRWKYAFVNGEFAGKSESSRYYPEFDLGKRSTREAPEASEHVEAGLHAGRAWLERQMQLLSASYTSTHKDHGLVDVNQLRDDLLARRWLVLPTDKNLGCAVLTMDWYLSQARAILSDRVSYRPITTTYARITLGTQKKEIRELSEHFCVRNASSSQIREWLVSRINTEHPFDGLPHFYVIPKIHKSPWKARPIVPCHSSIQSPAAKLLDFVLQDLLKDRPYILQSSKALAQALQAVKLPPGKRIFLVTGDVTAFYPNVDVEIAHDVCREYWEEGYELGNSDSDVLTKDFTERLWKVANGPLIMRFQDELFLQEKGLAMGVACSPTIANLYGAKFEELIVPQIEDILLYKRYIDDCFSLVIGVNEREVLGKMQVLKFPGCEIVWSVSSSTCVFLDMEISLDPNSTCVEFKPYRKPQNSFERIPWVSHHPIDVKRGTFIGEMTRLASLSSRKRYYEEALSELRDIYLGRGYPKALVDTWLRTHATERWFNRFLDAGSKRQHENVHVLKTVFNPVWEYVKADDLRKVIMEHWSLETTNDDSRFKAPMLKQTRLEDFFPAVPKESKASLPSTSDGTQLLPPVEDDQLIRRPEQVVWLHKRFYKSTGDLSRLFVQRVSASPPSPEEPQQRRSSGPSPAAQHGPATPVRSPEPAYPTGEAEEGELPQIVNPIVELLDRRVIFSRKRTRTLGDFINDCRRHTLAYSRFDEAFVLDEKALARWSGI